MNKSMLFGLCVLFGLNIYGGEVTKTYYFPDHRITSIDDYQLVTIQNCLNTGYAGEPSLPWFAVKLLLPPGEKAVSFKVEGIDEVSIPGNYLIYPQQASRPVSEGKSGDFKFN